MNEEIILIAGYPKSGNTWLARLTAELVDCPMKGFYSEPEGNEIAIEGLERISNFVVYKDHQVFEEINNEIPENKILYIVRDPRDIAISGANYYSFFSRKSICSVLLIIPKIRSVYYKYITSKSRKIKIMIDSMIVGKKEGKWLSIPWNKHVESYLKSNVLIIRYEDLLEEPHKECVKILDFIGIKKSKEHINKSIYNQSFDTVKQKFKNTKDYRKANFLVTGKKGEWKKYLNNSQVSRIESSFKSTMDKVGYI